MLATIYSKRNENQALITWVIDTCPTATERGRHDFARNFFLPNLKCL